MHAKVQMALLVQLSDTRWLKAFVSVEDEGSFAGRAVQILRPPAAEIESRFREMLG